MGEFVAVAVGGALGSVARYAVYLLCIHYLGSSFPFGTLFVNIIGSFVMGVLIEAITHVWTVASHTRLFLAVGILGAFTTFSTFSLDVAVLYERGKLTLTAVYMLVSVVLSIGALFSGLYLVRRFVPPAG